MATGKGDALHGPQVSDHPGYVMRHVPLAPHGGVATAIKALGPTPDAVIGVGEVLTGKVAAVQDALEYVLHDGEVLAFLFPAHDQGVFARGIPKVQDRPA